jgi:hypothetical protein
MISSLSPSLPGCQCHLAILTYAAARQPLVGEHNRLVQDADAVRAAFTEPREFWSSPLYRNLSSVVAGDGRLVGLAAHARAGQWPTFAFFGAIHALLLGGVRHPLADYYPSLRGAGARAPDDAAGAALRDFAGEHESVLRGILEARLVQTNHFQRSMGLRLGLAAVAERTGQAPVHLLEVGTSAGLVLRQAAYGYVLGGRHYGLRDSPVQLVSQWRSDQPVPDLDAVPALASVTGIDLNPLDPANEEDRRWLEALVWPEDTHKAEQLRTALAVAARSPVPVLAGDAVDLCPQWAAGVPAGDVRVVFHCATRMHVPRERLSRFDAAIDGTGDDGPLYRIAIEVTGIVITGPDGSAVRPYDVEGHLGWVRPAAGL